MPFFLFVLRNKASLQMARTSFHPPCVLTTNVCLLTTSLLLTWSFCSGFLHSPGLAIWLCRDMMGGRKAPGTEYLCGAAFQVIRMGISIGGGLVLDPLPSIPVKYIPR